jgi:hypothetical protein
MNHVKRPLQQSPNNSPVDEVKPVAGLLALIRTLLCWTLVMNTSSTSAPCRTKGWLFGTDAGVDKSLTAKSRQRITTSAATASASAFASASAGGTAAPGIHENQRSIAGCWTIRHI